ncbi:MAG TPA: ATP-binding protein [Kofleriaceae bacterium]|nr:ATP-binding protein [Kofleriaceae bacterium]
MSKLLRYLVLPREISGFERAYLKRLNRIALIFFWMHLPVFAAVAALAGQSVALVAVLTAVVLVGPTLAYRTLANPRTMALVSGVTAMMLGGILVYAGQGPMQIEMHFYFFVLLALLAVFGNPLAILSAALTVALHHLVLWLVYVQGVFNYDAAVWAVGVHAIFVVLESVAACFVARSFFDNVIGLERIVGERTRELDARNRDLKVVLDNIGQGFITVDRTGRVVAEPSRAAAAWFGEVAIGAPLWEVLAADDPALRDWMRVSWDALVEGFLPVELAIDQLPRTKLHGDRHLRFEYRTIGDPERPEQVVVVVTDATAQVERERVEANQREILAAIERASRDHDGFVEFVTEAERLVRETMERKDAPLAEERRRVHTLKGNTAMFGVASVSSKCHELEARMEEEQQRPSEDDRRDLGDRWDAYRTQVSSLVGDGRGRALLVDRAELDEVLATTRAVVDRATFDRMRRWRHEPTARRLTRIGELARAMASRLGKPAPEIRVEDHGLRLDSERWAAFWSAFVHAVRNAVDHGLEPALERLAAGKPEAGALTLRTRQSDRGVVIELVDDGRGVDWDAVAARAAQLGVPSATDTDRLAALFVDGLSTRSEPTETSGRGVGMSALRAAAEAMGGTVELSSARGRGTTVAFIIPHAVAFRSQRISTISASA